jgi:hypothetical protein
MSCISNEEKQCLFDIVRTELGSPIRKIELTDEMLDILLKVSVEDYARLVQNWLIDNQWPGLVGLNVSNADVAFALTTRSLNFVDQFTYAYSKITGNQARGPWELKEDYVTLRDNVQVYQIPAGREINEVLWMTAPSIDHALYSYYGFGGYGGYGFGAGLGMGAQTGYGDGGGGGYGVGGYYLAPAYDILLRASDFNLKQRIIRSELIYKVTAGPDGTRLLHLMSTPGSKLSFGHGPGGTVGLAGSKVWYRYYDTTAENIDQCRAANKDIIKLPNEVPLSKLDYCDLNEPTKIWVRQYLVAKSKVTLGRVRGKYSGALKVPEGDVTMDFQSLLDEGKEEIKLLTDELIGPEGRLVKLSTEKQLERQANEAQHLNNSLKFRPLPIIVV